MAATYPRPHFNREESWRYKRVKTAWRSPRGKTSRVRRSKKGWPPVVKIGYSRPKATRGMHPSGLREVLIYRPSDLEKIDSNTQVARIAHTVGENKRVLIVEEAKKKSIRVLNPGLKKSPEEEIAPTPATEPEVAGAEPATEAKDEAVDAERKEEKKTPRKKRKNKEGPK